MNRFDELKSKVTKGQLNRREFMTRALAAGATVALATSMYETAEAMTPKKGGHYKQALTGGATSDVLDPAQSLDSFMINVSFGQLRNCLTEIGSDGQLTGELAESWEASPDAKTWTFKLRKGVEFHNGKTMDSKDVVSTFNHHRGKDSKSAAKGIMAAVSDVKADGNDTVVFTLSGGNADFPFLVSDYHLCVCPADGDSIEWKSGTGTGAYSLVSFEPGVSAKVKRNPNYWKEGRGHFEFVDNLFIADVVARTNAVKSGEIHSMSNADLKTLHLLKRDQNLNVFSTNGNKQATFPMFTDTAPFDNVDVRLALKHAINREEMLKKIGRGQGELGNDNPIGPANVYRATAEEIPQRAYDPDKAKHLLKKAGLDGLKVSLSTSDTAFDGAVDATTLFSESAKAAGIEINIVRESNDGYWSNVWLKKPFVACYWGGRPTEDWIFSQIYAADASWNDTKWKNPRFNELLVQARGELDSAKRREMYVEMQRICNEDGGVILPMFLAYTHAASKKIALPKQIAGNWELDGHKNAERWWFA